MDIFYWEKAYFTSAKIVKSDFAPSEKYSSYATGTQNEWKVCLITFLLL